MWPWPGVIEDVGDLISVALAAYRDLTSATGRSQCPNKGILEWLAGLLERGAGYALKGLEKVNSIIARLSLWIWVISVAVGALFFGVGAGAGATMAKNIGIGLAASVVIQQVAESVLAIIGLVRYFAKLSDDADDETVDAEVEKELEQQDDALEAAGVDRTPSTARGLGSNSSARSGRRTRCRGPRWRSVRRSCGRGSTVDRGGRPGDVPGSDDRRSSPRIDR